ncbi:transcription factor TGAL6-like isoform X2 [Nymphaea colorata]|uniref:transcription factor TGAL6-like isoform X2 n=1 Tax=Nymphaea colorata TaxID=210225 RepID=UPI00129DC9D5|nr:transcription factor TGAL6-like isoform X2 [Nymphaea colorata]
MNSPVAQFAISGRMGLYEASHNHWGQSFKPESSLTSMILEPDQKVEDSLHGTPETSKSSDQETNKPNDKVLRRLAQNREAARKSRLRKKAYVQQLESSRLKLTQLEQELERARQPGVHFSGSCGDSNHGIPGASTNTGMWRTSAERFFLWIGGFRPSELLKILRPQLYPLAENQVLAICSLEQSSLQAEDALSQGMEKLQETLAEALVSTSVGSPNVADYMGQMASAMDKLEGLANFVLQADNLRQQTLQRMYRILTVRQSARGLLVLGDYFQRLRALSSLWTARPREPA